MGYNQQKCLAAEILTALSIVLFVAMVGIAFIMNKRSGEPERVPEYSSISRMDIGWGEYSETCYGESCANEKGTK